MPASAPASFDFVTTNLPAGLSVIEASAGTGKTFAVSHLVPRLLMDGTLDNIGEALLVTFTNDAAGELSGRVRKVLEKLAADPLPNEATDEPGLHQMRTEYGGHGLQHRMQQALVDIDQLTVSTIHSFCKRTLDTEGAFCGVPAPLELITDAEDLLEEAVYDIWQARIVSDPDWAAKVAKEGWKIEGDVEFIKKAMALDHFEPVPPFKTTLIYRACESFTEAMLAEVDAFFAPAERTWNKESGQRTTHLQAIRSACARGYCDTAVWTDKAFWDALKWLSKIDACIPKKNRGQLEAEANALEAVVCAKSALADYAPAPTTNKYALLWNWQNECLGLVRERVLRALDDNRQITQDGLITRLRDSLHTQPALINRLRERYKVALIDESQDTDPRQFEIFEKVFLGSDHHRLVLIGDPKQSIYAFRGADVNTYLGARKKAGTAVFPLNKTYRSPEPLVNAVNAFFARDKETAFLKEGLVFEPAEAAKPEGLILVDETGAECDDPVEAWLVSDTANADYQTRADAINQITQTVASKIAALLNRGKKKRAGKELPLEPSDFAVLTNSKRQAGAMAAELKARGVPAVVASDEDVLESEEAWELACLMRAMQLPRHSKLRYAALATRLVGCTDAQLRQLREGVSETDSDESFIDLLTLWRDAWEKRGIAHALNLVDQCRDTFKRLAQCDLGERRVTNLRQLIDVLQTACDDHSRRPELLLRWFTQEIQRSQASQAPEERQLRLENDGKAVQVLTMHKSKGLEFEFVFCPYLWDMGGKREKIRKLAKPDNGSGIKDLLVNRKLLEGKPKYAEVELLLDRSQLEDRLRLVYVAMTRAKSRLWIYGGRIGPSEKNQLPASPIDWLLRRPSAAAGPAPLEAFTSEWLNLPELVSQRGTRHEEGFAALNALIAANQWKGSIHVCAPPSPAEDRWSPPGNPISASRPLSCQPLPHKIPRYWLVTSFSALTREKNRHGNKISALPAESALNPAAAASTDLIPLNAFATSPGSALIGDAIHQWMERWDFAEITNRGAFESNLAGHLKRFPLLAKPDAAPAGAGSAQGVLRPAAVADMLQHLRTAELPGLGCSVAKACPSAKASEWNFHLRTSGYLSPQKLAEAFDLWKDSRYPNYAEAIGSLPQNAVKGYLQGYMDRLAVHEKRYGVIDWKTNHLGNSAASYSEESLVECAAEHHYLLQAHLYLVALRRFLPKLPSERLAGAWLVFLRGVHAEAPPRGILHINPPAGLLDALDHLFAR